MMKARLVDGKILTEKLPDCNEVLEVEYEGVTIGTANVVFSATESRTCHCGKVLNDRNLLSLEFCHIGETLDYEWQRSP